MREAWRYIIAYPSRKVKVDVSDFERVNSKSWRVTKSTQGRERIVTSVRTPEGFRTVTLGRFILNPPLGLIVYAQEVGEILDYRKSNLTVCTHQQMHQAFGKRKAPATSIFRGVSFRSKVGKWRAQIEVDGKSINLGDFDDEVLAALAWNSAARVFFGPKCFQNKILRTRKIRVAAG